MKMNNGLYAARCFIVKNRWHLSLTIGSAVLGYLMGRFFGDGLMTYFGTDQTTSTAIGQLSVKCCQGIQMKIDKIGGDVQELRAYVATIRQTFGESDGNTFRFLGHI